MPNVMKRIAPKLIILLLIIFGCTDIIYLDEGFYVQSNYLKYIDKYSETNLLLNSESIVIKVCKDTIKTWGDITYWGKSLILGEENVKQFIFQNKVNNKIYLPMTLNGEKDTFEFVRIKNSDLITDKGLDFEKLSKIKSNNILTGKYTYKDGEVNFNSNGDVKGLTEFAKYRIYLRLGTNFPYPSTNLINTDNGIWEFKIISQRLILTRFNDKRNETDEQFKLSDKIIELKKH